jgi:crossover junction endodeoxyribonuclease RuvC
VKILGIDPGLRTTGYGIVEARGNQLTALACGEIRNPATRLPSRCLVHLGDAIRDLVTTHQPEVLAVEGLVYVQNTKVAFTLGQVRGVVIAVAAAHGLEVYEYAPRQVKRAVTGLGAAGKQRVAQMVKALLGLATLPSADAADALGLTICHAHSRRGLQLKPARPI